MAGSALAHLESARAGRCFADGWPAHVVSLSFDSDHETNELRDGKSIGRLSWGLWRVLACRAFPLLERHDVRASFYVPAVTALIHPENSGLGRRGMIGIHGWICELSCPMGRVLT